MLGGGITIFSSPSPKYAHIIINSDLFKNLSLLEIKNDDVRKSYVAAISGSPLLGIIKFFFTSIRILASA